MTRRTALIALVATAGLAAGLLLSGRVPQPAPAQTESAALVGQPRPPFTLGATDGQIVSVDRFDGNVLLLNFWATWCAPCRKEMPMLSDLHARYAESGLSIVGIALDDVQPAREFAESLGVGYPVLVGGVDVMAASLAYGNREGVLPYSVLVDRAGIVRWTLAGVLDESELEPRIAALLRESAAGPH